MLPTLEPAAAPDTSLPKPPPTHRTDRPPAPAWRGRPPRQGPLRCSDRIAQIEVISGKVRGRLTVGALDLGLAQLWFDRAGDAGRDLVLQVENVVERAVEAVGPDVSAGRGVDQLPGDAHPVAGFAHAAFEHVAHAELLCHLLHVDLPALVGEGGVAGDD